MNKNCPLTPTQLEAYALLKKYGTFYYSSIHQSFTAAGCFPKIHPNTAKELKRKNMVSGKKARVQSNHKILTEITLLDETPISSLINDGSIILPIV